MIEVSAYEAKAHLPNLLKQVEGGEVVTITRNGMPVARLVPVHGASNHAQLLEDFLAHRASLARPPSGQQLLMRSLIDKGRRAL